MPIYTETRKTRPDATLMSAGDRHDDAAGPDEDKSLGVLVEGSLPAKAFKIKAEGSGADSLGFNFNDALTGPEQTTLADVYSDYSPKNALPYVVPGHFPLGENTTALWHILAEPLIEEISRNNPISATGALVEDDDGFAWLLDGVTEEINWGTYDYLNGVEADIAIRMLCKGDTTSQDDVALAKSSLIASTANDCFSLAVGSSATWRFRMGTSAGNSTTQGGTVETGALVEVAGVYEAGNPDSKKQRCFVDGTQVKTNNHGDGSDFHNTDVRKLYFGADSWGLNNWAGRIYAVDINKEILAGYEAV